MAELILSWRGAGLGLPYVKNFNIGGIMAKSPTIKEVKKAKIELESAIMKLMQDFEDTNGVFVGYINVQRKHDDRDYAEPERPEKRGPINNVDVNMDLDLIY
jgi:hypothetical protein